MALLQPAEMARDRGVRPTFTLGDFAFQTTIGTGSFAKGASALLKPLLVALALQQLAKPRPSAFSWAQGAAWPRVRALALTTESRFEGMQHNTNTSLSLRDSSAMRGSAVASQTRSLSVQRQLVRAPVRPPVRVHCAYIARQFQPVTQCTWRRMSRRARSLR